MKETKLTILPGDGIGPEVMDSALAVLDVVGNQFNLKFELQTELIGGASLDVCGEPITDAVLEKCKESDHQSIDPIVKQWNLDATHFEQFCTKIPNIVKFS